MGHDIASRYAIVSVVEENRVSISVALNESTHEVHPDIQGFRASRRGRLCGSNPLSVGRSIYRKELTLSKGRAYV